MESKEEIFKKEIQPLVKQLALACCQNGLPCFLLVADGEDKKTGKFDLKVQTYLPETLSIPTDDTIFADLVNVLNGFTTVPPTDKSNFSLDMNEINFDLPQEENL